MTQLYLNRIHNINTYITIKYMGMNTEQPQFRLKNIEYLFIHVEVI